MRRFESFAYLGDFQFLNYYCTREEYWTGYEFDGLPQ